MSRTEVDGVSALGLGQEAGGVVSVSVRATRLEPPRSVASVVALGGAGLAGDVHADPLSPRQVLLAGVQAYDRCRLPGNALRENLLLDLDTSQLRSGMLLRVGAEAVLWLTFQCEACGYLDIHAPGLSRQIGAQRGMLARVLRGGELRPGDSVACLDRAVAGWPDDWRLRVARVLESVPAGMVLEYRQLALLAGVQSSYCRVFPKIAASLGLSHTAVSMNSASTSPRWDGRELFEVNP